MLLIICFVSNYVKLGFFIFKKEEFAIFASIHNLLFFFQKNDDFRKSLDFLFEIFINQINIAQYFDLFKAYRILSINYFSSKLCVLRIVSRFRNRLKTNLSQNPLLFFALFAFLDLTSK